ncbi:carbohydrate ABC transporter permease [candidate division WOR-3 bacterium]|nr:carbohydrate ABC transporter permease [candidate division WOR-3 bacterium]
MAKSKKIISYTVLVLGAISMVAPFYWMLITAFKTPAEAIAIPPTWMPSEFTFTNFKEAWTKVPWFRYFFNTAIVAVFVLIGNLVTSITAGYAFSNFEFKSKNKVFLLFLATLMIPMPVYIIPGYLILTYMNWIDTYAALIVPWTVSVFSIFLVRQHMKSIPSELWDASRIDGCGRFCYLFRVVVPLIKPALATVSIFSIVSSWNSFLWPLVVTNSKNLRPIQVGLAYFTQEQSTDYTLLSAAATFTAFPLVILFLFAQKQIINSFTRSGLKD